MTTMNAFIHQVDDVLGCAAVWEEILGSVREDDKDR
jgi:hypothetical protein